MEFFKHNTRIDFMAQRWKCALLSLVLFVLSIIAIWTYGLNVGLDFTSSNLVTVLGMIEIIPS
jgi:preprotein translocase subunit SecF